MFKRGESNFYADDGKIYISQYVNGQCLMFDDIKNVRN